MSGVFIIAWGVATFALAFVGIQVEVRYHNDVVARTGRGVTHREMSWARRAEWFTIVVYGVSDLPDRMRNLFARSPFPELERERRIAVALLAISVVLLFAPLLLILASWFLGGVPHS